MTDIIGKSENMQRVFALIDKIADSDSTVIIQGESGTGKELVAKAIHHKSSRGNKEMISVNCGAIPEGLMESELFGHEQGAFTNAIKTRIGKFELANNSTIFLDEIADMSPALQVKILRVLEEQAVERVGGVKSIKINTRVIAATNKDIEVEVKKNHFREDLFYRLNVIPVFLPPLRERKKDIPSIVEYYVDYFNNKYKKKVSCVSDEALKALTAYNWPGNVRQLRNIIERMVILKEVDVIQRDDLPSSITGNNSSVLLSQDFGMLHHNNMIDSFIFPERGISLKDTVDKFENSLILEALNRTNWVKNKAAALLGINRTTLIEKMKKKGISNNA